MASFGDVFGEGSVAYQLFVWGVANQVLQALAAPGFTELETIVNTAAPVQPLSAADSATAANRSFMSLADAQAEAAKQGINATRFAIMQHLAGNAPAPEQLAEALRRNIIPADGAGPAAVSFLQGIAEGNLLDKWGPTVQALAKTIPSPADVVDGIVRNQVTAAQGAALYETVGGDPAYLQLQVDINGRPPSPTELLELAMRGVIPWEGTGPGVLSFQQGIFEGDSKDKWEPAYAALKDYFPTVAEAVELYRWGIIGQGEAAGMMIQRGLTAEQAAWWTAYADANAVNDYRGLTEQSVLAMVSIGYMSDVQATTALEALHRGPDAIVQLLDYAHIQRAIQAVNQAVTRVGALFTARKITQTTASDALVRLGIESKAIADIVADWSAVAAINVKTLTEAQVTDAFAAGIMDQGAAMAELVNIGYSAYDSWVLLSIKAKTALPGEPAPNVAAGPGEVVTGTT
jgi:hypothetical protein